MAKLTKKCKQITNRCTCHMNLYDYVFGFCARSRAGPRQSSPEITLATHTWFCDCHAVLVGTWQHADINDILEKIWKIDHSTSYSHDVHHASPLTGVLPRIQFQLQPCPTSKHRQSQRAASCKRAARPALLPAQDIRNKSSSDQTLRKSLWLKSRRIAISGKVMEHLRVVAKEKNSCQHGM